MNRTPFKKLSFTIAGLVTSDAEVSEHFDAAMQPIVLAVMDDAQLVSELVGRIRVPDFSVEIPIYHPKTKVFLSLHAEQNSSGFVATDLNIRLNINVNNYVFYSDVDSDLLEEPMWVAAMHEIWRRVMTGDTTPITGKGFVGMLQERIDYMYTTLDRIGQLKEAA